MQTVVVAFSGEVSCIRIREILESAGAANCLIRRSADQVRRTLCQQRVAGVICGYKFPDGTAEELREDLPGSCPMLVVAAKPLLEHIQCEGILKLASPLSRSALLSAVEELLRGEEEERALIARAKEYLMQRYGLSEEQAHRNLQRRSMTTGLRLAQVARTVLGTH